MAEDLQSLLEKINREGVEKAQTKADEIIAEAKAKADALIKSAREEAAKAKADAEKAAADYAARAAESVGQAARDTLIKVENSVTKLLTNLLTQNVERALADEKTVGPLIAEAIKGLVGEGIGNREQGTGVEVALPAKLAPALKAQLAAQGRMTVVTDDTLGTGFAVRLEGGRVEHQFTGAAVAEELAKRLRPDLAKIVISE